MRTRIIGIVLLVVGLGFAAWLASGMAEAVSQERSITGYILGLVLFSLPWFAVSLYLLLASRGEIKEESKADKERTILSAVMTRGRVGVADLAIECNLTREQVRDYVYDLIGKDLFRGYVNWDKGELVSAEAAQIKADVCPNCGGKVELAGKGLVRCPFCGTETYLSPPTSSIKSVHSREAAPPPSAREASICCPR
jgi:DNA-directed RNA polymerase subunit RPC12/RpoP